MQPHCHLLPAALTVPSIAITVKTASMKSRSAINERIARMETTSLQSVVCVFSLSVCVRHLSFLAIDGVFKCIPLNANQPTATPGNLFHTFTSTEWVTNRILRIETGIGLLNFLAHIVAETKHSSKFLRQLSFFRSQWMLEEQYRMLPNLYWSENWLRMFLPTRLCVRWWRRGLWW